LEVAGDEPKAAYWFVSGRTFIFASQSRCLHIHGGAAYDTTSPLTLSGTVKEFHFIQPHPLIALEVKDDKGTAVEWSIEMTAPNHLVRYGWSGKKLKPGDEITVTGSPAKNGLKVLNLRKILYEWRSHSSRASPGAGQ